MSLFRKDTFKLSKSPPNKAGYYYATSVTDNIPAIKKVSKNSDGCWVTDFVFVEDTSKPRVNGNIQGWVPKFVNRPLSDFVLWSERIPFPDGWPDLFIG